MNLKQDKKYLAFNQTKFFIKKSGAELTAYLPALGNVFTGFETRFAKQKQPILDIQQNSKPATILKGMLKEACFDDVWKLTSALQYYYKSVEDDIAANNVKMTEARLRKFSLQAFYLFSQMVIVQYDPALHNVYGLDELKMDALKKRLVDLPLKLKVSEEDKLKRKKGGTLLNEVQKDLGHYLKKEFSPLMEMVRDKFPIYYSVYRSSLRYGIKSMTSGKPHYSGKLNPGQLVVLVKKPYRQKLAVIVSVTGDSPIKTGIGIKPSEMHGTPFIIQPGKTWQRICQKLAPKGEYIMLQNEANKVAGYKVWLHEGSV